MPLYYGYKKEKKISSKNKIFIISLSILFIILLLLTIVLKNKLKYFLLSKITLNKIEKNIDAENYNKALTLIDEYLKRNFNPILFYYKGKIFYHQKKFFDANIELKKTLIFKNYFKIPDDVYYYIGQCNYYLGPGYYSYSLEYFKKYLKIYKNSNLIINKSKIYFLIGKIYIYFEEFKKADYYLTLIFNEYKNNLEYLYYYSISLKNNGKNDLAILYLKNVANKSKDPKFVKQAFFLLGKIYFEKKQYNDALFYFNNLLEIKPDSYWAYYYLGLIYYLNRELAKARNALSNSLHFNPDNKLALNLLKKISSGDNR